MGKVRGWMGLFPAALGLQLWLQSEHNHTPVSPWDKPDPAQSRGIPECLTLSKGLWARSQQPLLPRTLTAPLANPTAFPQLWHLCTSPWDIQGTPAGSGTDLQPGGQLRACKDTARRSLGVPMMGSQGGGSAHSPFPWTALPTAPQITGKPGHPIPMDTAAWQECQA